MSLSLGQQPEHTGVMATPAAPTKSESGDGESVSTSAGDACPCVSAERQPARAAFLFEKGPLVACADWLQAFVLRLDKEREGSDWGDIDISLVCPEGTTEVGGRVVPEENWLCFVRFFSPFVAETVHGVALELGQGRSGAEVLFLQVPRASDGSVACVSGFFSLGRNRRHVRVSFSDIERGVAALQSVVETREDPDEDDVCPSCLGFERSLRD